MATPQAAFVQGASRGIGLEFVRQLLDRREYELVFASCREPGGADALTALGRARPTRLRVVSIDVRDESSIAAAASRVRDEARELALLINVAGVLHGPTFWPEKKLAHVDPAALRAVFDVNAFGPLLVAKHFVDFFRHPRRSVFASMSARVGSISDNRLGGWYAYRGSKAAQNMFTKNLAIELGRISPSTIVLGLHPGTVDTDLSKPFQRSVTPEKLFDAHHSVSRLLDVIDAASPNDSGKVLDFRGDEVPA